MTNEQWRVWRDERIKGFEHELGKAAIISRLLDSMEGYNYRICVGNFLINANKLTRETTIFNIKTKKVATAKCNMSDSFTLSDGVAITWAKYTNTPVPTREETINREVLENGDIFYRPGLDKHETFTFIGWIPNFPANEVGKWGVALERGNKVIKIQIPYTVNRL